MRLAAIVCSITLAFAGTAMVAHADDIDQLNAQKTEADQKVSQAAADLDQSTANFVAAQGRVSDATTKVNEAAANVAVAQQALNAAEAALAEAQAQGKVKDAELAQAQAALAAAQAKEREGQAKIDAQKSAINAYARSIVQDSMPLMSVASLIDATSTASLSNRVQWNDTVLSSNQVDLDGLRALQEELEQARIDSQFAQNRADQAKKEADAQIAATAEVQRSAEQARDGLQSALDQQREALATQQAAEAAAQQAKSEDEAMLAQTQAEAANIDAKIAEEHRLAEERRLAEEAAAAQAARDAANQATPQPDPAPPAASSDGLIWPVNAVITDLYGYRWHPIWGSWMFHDGLDLGASCGLSIKAPAGGVITDEYYSSGYGYRLFIDHGYVNGHHMVTSYNHMSGYALGTGTWVSQGDTVGYVGTTGNSTGCHLHLMMWVDGSGTDPLPYLP
ncbi:MAG: peptidoglycan DD-metalloendopeptidase family protein [Propionibacteriaceae bacterium]|nr:peptidoglycan DD-metalloendopeptidase family protein [Propionibacteriaceae bacterium]